MTAESAPTELRRSRGDRQREAIIAAVRELLQERSFADLSVSTISERAGVARSGFYFYFDSKYAVLAVILAEASEELDRLTHDFAPREPGESPSEFAKRMVGSAAAVYANNDPVMRACAVARNTDAQIREIMDDFYDGIIDKMVGLVEQDAGRRPISDDLPALVRTLAAVTSMTLTQDSAFVGRGEDVGAPSTSSSSCGCPAVGRRPTHKMLAPVIVTAMAQGADLAASVASHRCRQRHRPRDRAEAGRRGRRALSDRPRRRRTGDDRRRRPRAGRARCPSTAHSTSPTMTRSPRSPPTSTPTIPAMDVVMNIAGVSAWGTVDQLTHQHWKSMVDINLMGPIHVIETFIPPMVAAGRGGHLVNVSSAAGLVALPWHAAYSASKYGLRGLSRGVALRPGPAPYRRVGGGARCGENPLVQTVQIAGVDREDPRVKQWTTGSAATRCRRNTSPTGSCAACAKNRYLIYTSPDIRALYLFKRTGWWPYSVAMRQVNVLFTRALRPGQIRLHASLTPADRGAIPLVATGAPRG